MPKTLSCSEVWGGGSTVDTDFDVPGMAGALYSRAASGDAGGDIYLVSCCDRGVVSKVVLADVAGHGHEVARTGQTLAELLRANVNERDNDHFLKQLNRQFEVHDDFSVVFATLACTTYFTRTQEFCFAYAGHPLIVLGRAGRFELLAAPPGPRDRISNLPIGVDRDASFHEGRVRLQTGDWLVLLSDGVLEARNEDGQEYGTVRLLGDLRRLSLSSPTAVKNGLLTRLRGFVAPRQLDQDDVTLIVLRANAPPEPPRVKMAPQLQRILQRRRADGQTSDAGGPS